MKPDSSRRSGRFLTVFRLILALLIFGVGLLGYRSLWHPPRDESRFEAELMKVVDGDTIRVKRGAEEIKVRLVGIDAAELGTAESFRCALRVAELLEPAATIEIEPEPTQPTDKYGRTLAWVWFSGGQDDEQLLQEVLVREGLCELYREARSSKYYGRLELAWRMH